MAQKILGKNEHLISSRSNVESKFEHLLNELETSDISTVSLAIRLHQLFKMTYFVILKLKAKIFLFFQQSNLRW